MSNFGAPGGGQKIYKPSPPERGSFPLDHDAECKHIMMSYLSCIRSHRGTNDNECRNQAKSYLQCRMERNLMAPDSFKNLGFGEDEGGTTAASSTATSQAPDATPSAQQSQDKPR
ncbi:hypothetical protein EJ04DRAFT_515701 [Polyplosphaeria fusca]|uniref:Cytochrome c oxidase assembly protein COX19 n=1 Tax=Polyplosphaeria fusca TaxID=682080 RepID=A0A9P4UVB4_9PLEO|nr:hypothetical protein EJ04DRAFT_515701 [Polyplosphaeria fusca]